MVECSCSKFNPFARGCAPRIVVTKLHSWKWKSWIIAMEYDLYLDIIIWEHADVLRQVFVHHEVSGVRSGKIYLSFPSTKSSNILTTAVTAYLLVQ
jgi:hypothetical protein